MSHKGFCQSEFFTFQFLHFQSMNLFMEFENYLLLCQGLINVFRYYKELIFLSRSLQAQKISFFFSFWPYETLKGSSTLYKSRMKSFSFKALWALDESHFRAFNVTSNFS